MCYTQCFFITEKQRDRETDRKKRDIETAKRRNRNTDRQKERRETQRERDR